ncbi:dynamin family protein [Clostridium aceticum]|uniref:Dynamin family protein n=1 Tax=Clostridium aceticum TaxID=84022 RepID=A0A0G3WCI0_9CLOT|nr:dynamin family protein [Clostridium aceticum]AKL95570.1 dynamin family protein [Clostridium aceticum]
MLKELNRALDTNRSLLKEIENIAVNLDCSYISDKCHTLLDRMEKLEFHVVVIGQFKRGKSTLLNYFMGEELLPTGVIPITSIITKLKYGDQPKARVIFHDESQEEVDIHSISQYISEQENPENIKQVDCIEVFIPSDLLKGGLVFIDTPGIGSIYAHNTEVAYNYLSEADAAIFLISSDAPVGEIELEFLMQVKKYINKIFFIQNKMDYLSHKELKESMVFSCKAIDEAIGKEPKLYPISAKLALEGKLQKAHDKVKKSGIKQFEIELESFMMKDKGIYLINSYQSKIESRIRELEEYIDFKINLLNSDLETLEKKVETLKHKLKDTQVMQREAMAIIELGLEGIIESFSEEVRAFRHEKVEMIKNKLKEIAKENQHISSNGLAEILNEQLESEVENVLGQWNQQQEIKIRKSYEELMIRFTRKLNEIIEQINELIYALFKIKVAEDVEEFHLIERDSFYFKFNSSSPPLLAPKIKDFMFLLPKRMRNRRILVEALKRVENELEKNGNNLKWDYVCKIRDSKYIFERTFYEHIQAVMKAVEVIIERTMKTKRSKGDHVEKEIRFYEEKKKVTQGLKHRLYRVEELLNRIL